MVLLLSHCFTTTRNNRKRIGCYRLMSLLHSFNLPSSPPSPPRLCEKAFMFSSVPFEHRDEAASHEQYREWEEKNFRIVHLHRCNFFNSSRVGTKFVISENLFPDSKMISEFIQRISFFFFFVEYNKYILSLIDDRTIQSRLISLSIRYSLKKKETIHLTCMEK